MSMNDSNDNEHQIAEEWEETKNSNPLYKEYKEHNSPFPTIDDFLKKYPNDDYDTVKKRFITSMIPLLEKNDFENWVKYRTPQHQIKEQILQNNHKIALLILQNEYNPRLKESLQTYLDTIHQILKEI